MLGSLHTVFLDRSSHPLSLPTFRTVFLSLSPTPIIPLLVSSSLPSPFCSLSVQYTHSLSVFPFSLSLSLCVRVSTSSYWFRQGSCVRNGNYFLKRNKMESCSRFDYICTNSNVRYFFNNFLRLLFHVQNHKIFHLNR